MNKSVYEKITDIIIRKLEDGVVPWRKPWNGEEGMPRNLITKKAYQGINVFLLSCLGYKSPYFLSFNQAKKLGGSIRRGEQAELVVFYKWVDLVDKENDEPVLDKNGQPKKIPMLRYYYVFNLEQCHGIDPKHVPEIKERHFEPITKADLIVRGMPEIPQIKYGENRASYSPLFDTVNMPAKNSFVSDEEMYSTLFHELVHWTGHESRLKRKGIVESSYFGSEKYSQEELIAEMGSAFLCSTAGIENKTIDNSAAYINAWLSKLKNDKKLIVIAAGQAQKACDFILDTKWKEKARDEKPGNKWKNAA
jgi:antirestriction protein ArdC